MSVTNLLHLLSKFISGNGAIDSSSPTYWYEGTCPQTGAWLRLPRTPLAEAIARGLMQQLAGDANSSHEGKMYGIVLVETLQGEKRVLKAFSGLLDGESEVAGWVPPIPGREQIFFAEARTLGKLEAIKQELIALQNISERQEYNALSEEYKTRLEQLSFHHRQRKQERHTQRQHLYTKLTGEALAIALEQLDEQSRQDGIERRQLKRQRERILQPLQQQLEQADQRIRELKQQRKTLSRQLQAQMHAAYCLTNFAGETLSLQQLITGGVMPTGTGDCCAPKLLHYAATHQLKPLAMAEFWWGLPSAKGDKLPGQFYGACAERCQPLMGFLLSGLSQQERNLPTQSNSDSLPIIYEDESLIAVNKPPGLLSIPGRSSTRYDSVLTRLKLSLLDGETLISVHRLDRETSGILLLARDLPTYRQLSAQFQNRQVHKVYETVLAGILTRDEGEINLPLLGDPRDRPRQKVDWQHGKPSLTNFKVIARAGNYTRLIFLPITGRTHQLRVHAADARGLGMPILGDRLYGCVPSVSRLYLHARELSLQHPHSGEPLCLQAQTPF